jgi:PAS domain S-box-containing protein
VSAELARGAGGQGRGGKKGRIRVADSTGQVASDTDRARTDFGAVYEAHFEQLRRETFRKLGSIAEFELALASVSGERARAEHECFLRAWATATAPEWSEREAGLARCREFFAASGVGLGAWSAACALVQTELTPLLIAAYGCEPERLAASLGVLQLGAARVSRLFAEQCLSLADRVLAAERQRTERALTRFARLSDSGVLGVLVCDFHGNIKEANDGFLQTFGYSRAELLSGEVRWAAMTPPEWQQLDLVAIEQLRTNGKTRPWEKEYFHKNGSRIPVLVGVAALNESETIAFVLDVSERKWLEEIRVRSVELETQNRRIQEASRLKSEFLANMSHELRTPLNSIIGFTELLHDREIEPTSPQYMEFLSDILKSGRHLQRLINDVLDLAKVEAGKIELRPEVVDIKRLITEVAAVLRTVAASKRIQIQTEIAPEIGQASLDPGRFKQILYNYLSNALKFTPEGGTVKVQASSEPGGMFRVSVLDSGIGIAAADLGRLFVEFQQLEAGATKKHGGTGLGLALTKRLVEAQGGSVGVKSVLGQGSEFFAILPLNAGPLIACLEELSELPTRVGAASVLVVEDDARDRALLSQTLTRAGYGVTAAATGGHAIAACAERVFDAITLDLLLPDMTGLDVLHRIRLNGKNQNTPVIVVSIVAEQGILAGFNVQDYLTKPVSGRDLLHSLEQAAVPADKGGKILIVDDDPAAHRLMRATLEQLGYHIDCSSSGEEALLLAAEQRPLAVVLDLMMPGIDGFEFLLRFRAAHANRSVPVIVWTMKDLTSGDHRRLQKLAQGVVAKGDWTATSFLEELQGLIAHQRDTSMSEAR